MRQTIIVILATFCIGIAFSKIGCSGSSDSGSGVDSGADSSTDSDSDSDSDGDTDTDADTDTDGDTDTDADGDAFDNASGEICGNELDDDGDNVIDCADSECKSDPSCTSESVPEDCGDGVDNDFDGDVDCQDSDCDNQIACGEICDNGIDDDGDSATDCEDSTCLGMDPSCGEVCGDDIDNDLDGKFDCDDEDCDGVSPPCGSGQTADNSVCAYKGDDPHTCECADGLDNEGDGETDMNDLHCFGPLDDNEEEFATGMPGDNEGSKAYVECPFDGNSGIGNDDLCCNPADPSLNVVPNGCDDRGCCEVDINGNTTGEHVGIYGDCEYAPACGTDGTHNCACETNENCDPGQYCIMDNDTGPGFCSTCQPCTSHEECENPCDCGEKCFGGFERPQSECGGGSGGGDNDGGTGGSDTSDTSDTSGGGTCPQDLTACPGGDGDCNTSIGEHCVSGCCYPQCPTGVIPCEISADCQQEGYYCVTGCCIQLGMV